MRISDWSSDVCSSDLGVPAAQIGSVGGPIAGQINNFIGGNPALVPEKSTTWTIGAVIQPRALPGFTATVDFFDIKVKDAILQIPEQPALDICYGIQQDASGPFCSLIARSPTGRINGDTTRSEEHTSELQALKRIS